MAGEHRAKTVAVVLVRVSVVVRLLSRCNSQRLGFAVGCSGSVLHGLLTRPKAKEVLCAAGFDGAHGAGLDAHNGPFGAERHVSRVWRLECRSECRWSWDGDCGGEGGSCSGDGVVPWSWFLEVGGLL